MPYMQCLVTGLHVLKSIIMQYYFSGLYSHELSSYSARTTDKVKFNLNDLLLVFFHHHLPYKEDNKNYRCITGIKKCFSQYGRTALHKAAHHGSVSIVESLLNGDLTAAEELARAADKVIFLKEHIIVSNREIVHQEGRTALHYASRCPDADARKEIAETIVHAGGDEDEEDFVRRVSSFFQQKFDLLFLCAARQHCRLLLGQPFLRQVSATEAFSLCARQVKSLVLADMPTYCE